ncbi:DMT family transporter [Sphingomonas sp. So64.6b]|uniref:DMT family transporter n=1 Tax=Sphingomonas sp. So64.6b TaxID=2997354 RepID=UPI0016015F39|nr:DMT family transporter [Sphingomonas sp. So64.6b]QNA83487.1 DMT family transporter [Sphingomonas sp. So64.6b]
MSEQTRGTIEMAAAMTIAGTIGWFVIMSGQPVIDVVFWRCVFGAVTLTAICAARGLLRRDALSPRQLLIAMAGGAAIVLNWLLLFGAYGHSSISIATTVYNTQPFMLVALGALLFGERLTANKLLWLAVAFGGVLLLVQARPGLTQNGSDYLLGIGMALASAFFYALAAIAAKKLTGVPPMLIVLVQVIVGTVMLAPLSHLATPPSGASAWAMLASLGAIHTGLAFILLYGAIQKLPTHLVGALSFIYPLVAIMVDVVAFGHNLYFLQVVGGAAILLAAAATTLGWSPIGPRRTAGL